MEKCKRELDELKKEQGPERKMRKSDPFYPDYLRAMELAEEIKALIIEKKHVVDEIKKSQVHQQANFQTVIPGGQNIVAKRPLQS